MQNWGNASRIMSKNAFAVLTCGCPRVLTFIADDVILSNCATSEKIRERRRDVRMVWSRRWRIGCRLRRRSQRVCCWEFVLTCSRWQFSSNRLDYAPHLSAFVLPDSCEFAIRGARDCTRTFVWSNFLEAFNLTDCERSAATGRIYRRNDPVVSSLTRVRETESSSSAIKAAPRWILQSLIEMGRSPLRLLIMHSTSGGASRCNLHSCVASLYSRKLHVSHVF